MRIYRKGVISNLATERISRTERGTDHFDLLPFIALMMIVLATLLFITMAMASINVGAGSAEGWVPTTSPGSHSKVPVLVEWDGAALTIHRKSKREEIHIGEAVGMQWDDNWDIYDKRLRAFLNEMISNKKTHYVLFAVRPSGFGSFESVAYEFRDRGISVGYEPVEQRKRIRLKLDKVAQQ